MKNHGTLMHNIHRFIYFVNSFMRTVYHNKRKHLHYSLNRIHLGSDLQMAEVMGSLEGLGDLIKTSRSRREESEETLAGRNNTAQVFRVELNTDIPSVVLELDHFHSLAALVFSNERETGALQLVHQIRVHLVAVTMALPDLLLVAVQLAELGPLCTILEQRRPLTQPHCTPHLGFVDFRHVDDGRLLRFFIELCAIRLFHIADVASVFDHSYLQPKANAKEGDVLCTGPFGTLDHALGTALTEATLLRY